MTKETVKELYKKYEEADYKYHQFVEQFLTLTWNGVVTQEATKGLSSKDIEEIRRLDKTAHEAKLAYEEAMQKWAGMSN